MVKKCKHNGCQKQPSYNFEGQNQALFQDSLVKQKRYDLISQNFLNGISQNSTIQSTIGIFKNTWKLTPLIESCRFHKESL